MAAVDRDLAIGYVLRNLGGHQAGAPPVVAERVDELRAVMLRVLAACTDAYY